MANLYSATAVENLINHYLEKGGECYQIREGVLGCGDMILHGAGLKTAIIKEIALNEWSSGHTIRMYNKIPQKYIALLQL